MSDKVKDNFIIHMEFEEDVCDLTDEEAGQLFKALFKYARTGDAVEDLDRIVSQTFKPMRRRMDYDAEQYNKVKEARSQAGRTGASKRWEDSKAIANDNNGIAKDSKVIANDNKNAVTVTDTDTVIKEISPKGDTKKSSRFSPPTIQEVQAYALEMGYTSFGAERFVDFYKSKGWMVGKNKMKDWKAAVRNWAKNERAAPKIDPKKEFAQREYTQEDKDRRVLDIIADMEKAAGG